MLFQKINKHAPEHIALRDRTASVRYGDLAAEIQKRADRLVNVKVLGIALDNSVDWILWDLAALKAEIPCVPLPPFFTKDQISHVLQTAGVTHLLSPQGLCDTGISFQENLPKGTAKVTFTSGTTGKPKGVCLTQAAMEAVATSIVKILGDRLSETHASILPLAILLENVAGVYAALIAGCSVNLTGLEEFGSNYENIYSILYKSKATSAILVPEVLRLLLGQVATKGNLTNLKFIAIGGSKVDPALIAQAHNMGLPVYEGYGLSECASVVSLNIPKDNKAGTVGKFLPHVRARLVDGEVQIKNSGFLGYIGDTAPKLINSGDLGSVDENGFLSITGRKKNVLITSYGRNVSPEWVEAALLSQPTIAQAIVYGDAQPSLSALIVPSSINADIRSAITVTNKSLPDYARIEDFKIVPPFTIENQMLTGTGRPRREEILTYYTTQEKNHELLQSAC
jgi:long-chain acyl-CoA synthetase